MTTGSRKARLATSLAAALMFLTASEFADATTYTLAKDDDPVVGADQSYVTVYEDTLYDLARRFSLGSEELIRVNPGVDPWLPGAGKTIVVPNTHILPPGPREGIVVNLPEHRLYYYPKRKRAKKGQPESPLEVITYPVSIGKMDWRTPLGLTRVIQKQKNPIWFPPESVRKEHAEAGDPLPAQVASGPDNPLGLFAMRLAAGNGTYLIHGTNNPIAVGLAVTHGCIRMYPGDVEALFPLIDVGTPVRLINEPIKVAWVNGELLLEAHPPVDAEGQSVEPQLDQFSDLLQRAVGDTTVAIHWDYAREVLQKADGVIATVGLEADLPDAPGAAPAVVGAAVPSAASVSDTLTAPAATPAAPAATSPPAAAPPPAPAAPPTVVTPPAPAKPYQLRMERIEAAPDTPAVSAVTRTEPAASPDAPDAPSPSPSIAPKALAPPHGVDEEAAAANASAANAEAAERAAAAQATTDTAGGNSRSNLR